MLITPLIEWGAFPDWNKRNRTKSGQQVVFLLKSWLEFSNVQFNSKPSLEFKKVWNFWQCLHCKASVVLNDVVNWIKQYLRRFLRNITYFLVTYSIVLLLNFCLDVLILSGFCFFGPFFNVFVHCASFSGFLHSSCFLIMKIAKHHPQIHRSVHQSDVKIGGWGAVGGTR